MAIQSNHTKKYFSFIDRQREAEADGEFSCENVKNLLRNADK